MEPFQQLGAGSPNLWQTHLSPMGTAFQLICKFFLSVLHPTEKVTGLCVRCGVRRGCLFRPEVTYKVTTFSSLELGVLVNPYPFGMVITANQNRKISQKAQFCLASQQSLTHPPEKDCLRATMTQPLPYEFDFLTASNKTSNLSSV